MPNSIAVPINDGDAVSLNLVPGEVVTFVGANGAGKSRLTQYLEEQLGEVGHRVAAHRSVGLNPQVPKVSEEQALQKLRYGAVGEWVDLNHRIGSRWSSNPTRSLLADSDAVLQALFADQSRVALRSHEKLHAGDYSKAELTKFQRLIAIWRNLLPHRDLVVTGDDLVVRQPGGAQVASYSAADMSDGERSVVYLIGQVLVAAEDSVLIIDEPELHVHKSILAKLWDLLEQERVDCSFVYVSHDLDFAASRVGLKYVIRSYLAHPTQSWAIEKVPEDTGFPEDVVTLILGSRKPILFVEGVASGIDSAVYRCAYPGWTIIPCGSCAEVVHSVKTFRNHSRLTHLSCAGIVDADDYSDDEVGNLSHMGIAVLPVSEIENIFALPSVVAAICASEHLDANQTAERERALHEAIMRMASQSQAIDRVVQTYVLRTIDRLLKSMKVDAASSVDEIAGAFAAVADFDVGAAAAKRRRDIEVAVVAKDVPAILALFSDKALLGVVASKLKDKRPGAFEAWLSRALVGDREKQLVRAISDILPAIPPMASG